MGIPPAPTVSVSGASMQRCQLCGGIGLTQPVTFRRNVGMVLARRTYKISGNLCKGCIHQQYWKFQGLDLILGPWGTISLFMTPLYLIQNTVGYIAALSKMRGSLPN